MAYNAIRRSLTAGVALAGAGAITMAASPVPPDEQVAAAPSDVTAEVQLVAVTDDAALIGAGVSESVALSVDAWVTKIPALMAQVDAQWPDAELTHHNYALVADMFLMPLAPYVFRPTNDAVAQVLAQRFPEYAQQILQLPELSDEVAVRLIGPLLSAIGGAGAAHEQIYYSTTTGQLEPFFEAIAAAPGHVVDGLLNGGYGDLRPILTGELGGQPIPAPGLLTPWGEDPAPRDIKWVPDEPAEPEAEIATATVAQDSGDDSTTHEDPSTDETEPKDTPTKRLRGVLRDVQQSVRDIGAALSGARQDTADDDETPTAQADDDQDDEDQDDEDEDDDENDPTTGADTDATSDDAD